MKVLKLAIRESIFYEHPENFHSENIKIQECAVMTINFVRACSLGASMP
jgi:hypothetical protein